MPRSPLRLLLPRRFWTHFYGCLTAGSRRHTEQERRACQLQPGSPSQPTTNPPDFLPEPNLPAFLSQPQQTSKSPSLNPSPQVHLEGLTSCTRKQITNSDLQHIQASKMSTSHASAQSAQSAQAAQRTVPANMDGCRALWTHIRTVEKEMIYMQQQLEVVYRARDQFADVIRQGLNRQEMALLRLKYYWRIFLLSNGLTDADLRQQATGFPDSSDEDEDSSSAGYTSQQSESDV